MMNGGQTGIANYKLGLELGQQAYEISRNGHLDWHTITALGTLAESHIGTGDYRAALNCLKEANELALAMGAIRFMSLDMVFEGKIYLEINQPKRAEAAFRKSSQLSQEANIYLWEPRTQVGFALARLQQGDNQVGPLLKETLANARLRGQQVYFAHCFEGLAELALAQGAYGEAEENADSMLASAEQCGQREKIASAYRLRGKARLALAAQAGRSREEAVQDLQQAHKLTLEIGTPYLLWESHQALAQLYRVQGDQAQVSAHVAAKRAIMQTIVDNLQDHELTQNLAA
jgi:tetratricopeptide (TPR) repeat protein